MARLRLLLVEPGARGLGLGARLVASASASRAGPATASSCCGPTTHSPHARRIYQRAGFVLAGQKPHRSFGHDLMGQTWSLTL